MFTGSPLQHPYIPTKRTIAAEHGYLLMEYLEDKDGTMLSQSWTEGRDDPDLRQNLFHGLARIMLSLSRVPLSRIGSWTIDDQGQFSLTNRPLLHHLHGLENEGIPTGMSRTRTYSIADAFYSDLLSCHDRRILHQPNSILDEEDGLLQMACLFAMRGLAQNFTDPDLRSGPFAFTLTDLHASNIFVDKEWNIKHLIDLEWACSLPLEMHVPPYWLTDRGVDQLHDTDELERFDKLRQEFMRVYQDEEKQGTPAYGHSKFRTELMEKGWQRGSFWYFHALLSTTGCYNLFRRNIKPIFAPEFGSEDLRRYIAPFWCHNIQEVVRTKLADKEEYEINLREVFAQPPEDSD